MIKFEVKNSVLFWFVPLFILPDGSRVGVSVWLEVIEDVGIVVKFVVPWMTMMNCCW